MPEERYHIYCANTPKRVLLRFYYQVLVENLKRKRGLHRNLETTRDFFGFIFHDYLHQVAPHDNKLLKNIFFPGQSEIYL